MHLSAPALCMLSDPKDARWHLERVHGWTRVSPWRWGRESWEEYSARIEEQHLEAHLETPQAEASEHGHIDLPPRIGGNGCPVCGGHGQVLAVGFVGDPITVGCPECAGLAFTPASADDFRAKRRQPRPRPLPHGEPSQRPAKGDTRRLVVALDEAGCTVGEIAELLAVTPQAVTYHLRRDAGTATAAGGGA